MKTSQFIALVLVNLALLLFAFVMGLQRGWNNPLPVERVAITSTPLETPSERLVTSGRIKSVYDGDTVVLELTKEVRVRLLDCWAPEIRTRDENEKERGYAAKAYLESLLESGEIVLVDIPMTTKLQDSLTFGRVLAYIYTDVDDDGTKENVSKEMVEAGHATRTKQ